MLAHSHACVGCCADASTNLGGMRVAQLKQILEARGATCRDCFEKADYVARVRQEFGLA